MTNEIPSPPPKLDELRTRLSSTYDEIESKARRTILEGQTTDNPLLTGAKKETRYSIATCGFLTGPADVFLGKAAQELGQLEGDNFRSLPSGFRHIALRELIYGEHGRKALGIDAISAREYYRALQEGFQQDGKPIQLELVKIIPTIDREQNSVSIVGAFLPVRDTTIVDVRERINQAVQDERLPLQGRLGDIRVVFSTVGRLAHPPKREGERIPLLDILDTLNDKIPSGCTTSIESIAVASTTPTSYMWTDKNVFMVPPISFTRPNPLDIGPRFVTASRGRTLRQVGMQRQS